MDNARETNYELLAQQVESLAEGTPGWLPALANVAALLGETLPDINWVGFYVTARDAASEKDLPLLGTSRLREHSLGPRRLRNSRRDNRAPARARRPCVPRPHRL